MANTHGIYVQEEATALTVPKEASAGLQVVLGTAPVNLLDDPASAVNVPVLATSAKEAMAALGYSTDFDKYTLCQTMYITSNVYAVQPVVYINVLDPAKHKASVEATVSVSDKVATVEQAGCLKAGMKVYAEEAAYAAVTPAEGDDPSQKGWYVKDGDSYAAATDTEPAGGTVYYAKSITKTEMAEGTDYALSFDGDGYLAVTLIASSEYADAGSISVNGYRIDPEAVTYADVIGAYNVSTGAETGMEVIRQVYPTLGVVPGILLAPGYSHIPAVGIALSAKAASINGTFKAMAFVDLDSSARGAVKYTDCKTVKEKSGFSSALTVVCWPKVRIGDYTFWLSAMAAARTAFLDWEHDDVPSRSPSNKELAITAVVLEDGTEVKMDQDQATVVEHYGAITAYNRNGFRLWGDFTAAYPASGDAKDIWINVRRMFNWQGNTFIQTYFSKVDDPMNPKLIENIVDSENIRCASYAPEHWAGATIEYLAEDNTAIDIISGNVTFRQHIAPWTPAQTITDVLSYDIDALTAALTGGE